MRSGSFGRGTIEHHIFKIGESEAGVLHRRARGITLEADPPQDLWNCGEMDGKTPFTVTAMPQALEIVVQSEFWAFEENRRILISDAAIYYSGFLPAFTQ